jgi:hypothetical protein
MKLTTVQMNYLFKLMEGCCVICFEDFDRKIGKYGMGCWPPRAPGRSEKDLELFEYCSSYVIRDARNIHKKYADCFTQWGIKRKIKQLEKAGFNIILLR